MDILQEEEIRVDIKDKKYKFLYDYEHNFLVKELNDTKKAEITSENSNKEIKLDIDGTTKEKKEKGKKKKDKGTEKEKKEKNLLQKKRKDGSNEEKVEEY